MTNAARIPVARPVMEAVDLAQSYNVSRGLMAKPATVKAVAGISFALAPRSTLAVVGESGSGKSTLARMLTMIETPGTGALLIDDVDVAGIDAKTRRRYRGEVQMIFQNPYGSLNPRQTIGNAIEEPLLVNTKLSAAERRERAIDMMQRVGLRPEHHGRYPHMFSGGQRQRIAIARALVLRPKILVLDEPVSALDVSVRAQVLNLLVELQESLGVAYVFVSHDLGVVRHMADEVMVMYLGRAVEHGPRDAIFDDPKHPYTRALMSATPVADPEAKKERIVLEGELPSPFDPPTGCAFNPRCPLAFERCRHEAPPLELKAGRLVACWAVE
ncbi:dipeptide ABC transporter ATP-binding protein [Ancylobacter defluvii]|uniref:Dipeptide ABC transporter ATP-binding protein n=1 Tax=Ancylobacter defluvii TaxID=1282440 RepID=A0A9W6NBU1_9HYPH|nr:dipeptide ABC transporter ATP-binding protein [Ancylobacter defluvii]MBS7589254.1 dipeptide ABC transporter ATP-binding protein [Ancylobacter defluvii]GLK84866.1 dipeptide ABC transporter ATP-binding protein [Ancylobacter defluvii]